MTDPLIVFMPSGKRGNFPIGTPVLAAARALGVDIDSVCGTRGICARCQVEVSTGSFSKLGVTSSLDHVSSISPMEEKQLSKERMTADRRLSCQTQILGDLVIDVPEDSQIHKQVVRKSPPKQKIDILPVLKKVAITLEAPSLHTKRADSFRLLEACQDVTGATNLTIDAKLLPNLRQVLEKSGHQVEVVIAEDREIIAIWPLLSDEARTLTGLAVDFGTTTIAAHLCNLETGEVLASAGVMNPQIRFGEDLMSRVSYVQMNPDEAPKLTASAHTALTDLAMTCLSMAQLPLEQMLEVTIVGNPIMHHIFLGIDPTPLGLSPFPLAIDEGITLKARELGIEFAIGTRIHMLPCIAGHVGADAAGVILAEKPYERDDISLLVDVGTNAEIVLGNRHELYACSSPTGPAFEGAQISSGQRAAPGAIERIRIDKDTGEPRFKVIGSDLWSDEDGFEGSIEQTGVTGICGSGIIEAIAEMYLAGLITTNGLIDGAAQAKTDRIIQEGETFSYILHRGTPEIKIIQLDIRNIQLAKAAVYAGAQLLMQKMKIEAVDRVVLAGAFGSFIDPKYALVLGLIPDCQLDQVVSAGNSAGTGALMALLNIDERRKIGEIAVSVNKIETAVEADFQNQFVDAMAFPHKRHPFTHLAAHIDLPPRDLSSGDDNEPRRRRRRRG